MTATLLGFTLIAQTPAATITFSNAELGLSFEHPASWKREDRKVGPVFTYPIAGLAEGARLELYAVAFRDTTENWFRNENLINEQLKRTVERQWQEQILGVPMLMSRIVFTDRGSSRTTLVGLLYAATPSKMNFRLTCATAGFDDAEGAWRKVLESIRPLSGELPKPEDPAAQPPAQPTPRPVPAAQPARPPVRLEAQPKPARLLLGPVTLDQTVSARPARLRLPAGWSALPSEGAFALTRPGLSGTVRVELLSTIDSPDPDKHFLRLAAMGLEEFESVRRREEPPVRTARSGVRVSVVTREGASGGGSLVLVHAVGAVDPFYWSLTYRTSDPRSYQSDRRALQELLDVLRLESPQ